MKGSDRLAQIIATKRKEAEVLESRKLISKERRCKETNTGDFAVSCFNPASSP